MKKELLCAHEYRTPVCKVVLVHYEGALMGPSYGVEGEAGDVVKVEYDEYDY